MRAPARAITVMLLCALSQGRAQEHRPLMPIPHGNSADAAWLKKPVLSHRVLDDMRDSSTWAFWGTGTLNFSARKDTLRALRVDMQMFTGPPAPTRSKLSQVGLRRAFAGEDWRAYNRLSLWIRADFKGIPALPLQLVLHNDGVDKVPDRYNREGTHYVTLMDDKWTHVVWEIDPLARDKVTLLEIGYWVNKMIAAPGDRVAFEIADVELEEVRPDVHTGWTAAPGKIAFSHSGYQAGYSKTALMSGLNEDWFQLVDARTKAVVIKGPVVRRRFRLGDFLLLDFSKVDKPGTYTLRVGDIVGQPFEISVDPWTSSTWKALNFFYGERCGFDVPGVHGVDHLDWFATHGDQKISMAGGWHDAGDLSQGVINTGEATYSMFALAERLRETNADNVLIARTIDEARWGLEWLRRVRFDGGFRQYFAPHNLWTNNVVGDDDDRSRETKNNPNANYISAAAEAIAYRVLRANEPALADSALKVAEADWKDAIAGVESAETRTTPAFAATRMELASIGTTASVELYRATKKQMYADKAVELSRIVVASQQKTPVGREFTLSGFFWTGPDKDTLFHQFHRGNDQAPIVALAQMLETFPQHADARSWRETIRLYMEYQKKAATTTAPWNVLPAYVYRLGDEVKEVPDSGALHMATRESYRAQVQNGISMGDGWYLRAFPVWFARRGNYGVLLSQAKALATAARVLKDSAAMDLAQQQAQWVMGRNPFTQSTMYGEGYGWQQQYSVSSGDFVGSLPVGMQSKGDTDLPYWPAQNMYVYKEVWVHSTSRWLWLVADFLSAR